MFDVALEVLGSDEQLVAGVVSAVVEVRPESAADSVLIAINCDEKSRYEEPLVNTKRVGI